MKRTKNTLYKLFSFLLSITLIAALAIPASAESYDTSDATTFVFSDSGIAVTEGAYDGWKIDGTSLSIKGSGTYTVSGSCKNGTIVVKKNVTGVTLVLDGLTLSASATAPITCNKGSGVTILAAAGTVNNLSDDKYNNDDVYTDETLYPDIENAVIKCKDGSDVTICGTGTINVTANGKNGVKGGYDLYEEDADGNATDTLLSTSSLTIKDVTLNITAAINDGLKADKELNVLSGKVTVSAADDGIKSDYTLNIGQSGTAGPTITVTKAAEGIEAATLNVYSGSIKVTATDDGINAANGDIAERSTQFSYNQYGGYVYVNVTNGDGIDSNGTVKLAGGTLEVHSPAQGDGDPIDTEYGCTFGGATVLAVGHAAMQQAYTATTPYVVFGGNSGGRPGGFGGMIGGSQNNLVTSGSTIQITDASGNALYTATAVRNASYVLFASPDLSSGTSYTLKNGSAATATASAGTATNGGMGQFPGNGGAPGQNGDEGTPPSMPNGESPAPPNGESGNRPTPPDGSEPPAMPEDGSMPTPPDSENGNRPTPPDGSVPPDSGNGETPPAMPNGEMPGGQPNGNEPPQAPADGEMSGLPDGNTSPATPGTEDGTENDPQETQPTSFVQIIFRMIRSFFRSIFKKG